MDGRSTRTRVYIAYVYCMQTRPHQLRLLTLTCQMRAASYSYSYNIMNITQHIKGYPELRRIL